MLLGERTISSVVIILPLSKSSTEKTENASKLTLLRHLPIFLQTEEQNFKMSNRLPSIEQVIEFFIVAASKEENRVIWSKLLLKIL
jgi:hypothetical protein